MTRLYQQEVYIKKLKRIKLALKMKILHLSDTHGLHKNLMSLPEADVIVHSGDFTFAGSEEEACDFINWFCDLPYEHKVFIAGNHDMCMYGADHIEGLSKKRSLPQQQQRCHRWHKVLWRTDVYGRLYGWQTGHVYP